MKMQSELPRHSLPLFHTVLAGVCSLLKTYTLTCLAIDTSSWLDHLGCQPDNGMGPPLCLLGSSQQHIVLEFQDIERGNSLSKDLS